MANMVQHASANIKNGFNCAQSVLIAFASQFGMTEEEAARIAAGFGSGMGRTGQTCGAVSGSVMVIGLRYGMSGVPDQPTKDLITRLTQQFFDEFKQRNQTPICHELLGVNLNTPEGYAYAKENNLFKTRCVKFVEDAAEIVEHITGTAAEL